jgi:hypothetical protein
VLCGALPGGPSASSSDDDDDDEDEDEDEDGSSDEGSQFPDQPVAPPGPAGPVVALNVYPAPPAFQTAQCPPQVDADPANGSYDLPEPPQGPDRLAATCDCKSGRQTRALGVNVQCDACDGGECGEYLDNLLQKAIPDSGDALSCTTAFGVSRPTHPTSLCPCDVWLSAHAAYRHARIAEYGEAVRCVS